jgi:hypothetical protein
MSKQFVSGCLCFLFGLSLSCQKSATGDKSGNQPPNPEPQFPAPSPNAEPGRLRPGVQMVPPDMTSSVGNTPLQILVYNGGEAVGKEILDELAKRVRLVTWPENIPVDVTTVIQDFAPRRENNFPVYGSATISVRPSGPLADRWYFLHLASLPSSVRIASAVHISTLPDGRVGARFGTGSDPRLAWVRRCTRQGEGKIAVDFSESVDASSPTAVRVQVAGKCERTSYISDGGNTGRPIIFTCTGVDERAPFRVTVAANLMAATGRPVRDAGKDVEVEPAAFRPWGDCEIASAARE